MLEFLKHRPKVARPTFAPLDVDIHCHLLPGVDDGSKSVEESAVCLRIMRDAGFQHVICTPHYQVPRYPNDESDIRRRFTDLQMDLSSIHATDTSKLAGVAGEYRVDTGFNERVEKCNFLLVGGKYILAEFSLHQQALGCEDLFFQLQMKNYEIILAHPERYPYYSSSSNKLAHLKDMGISFQVNILSLVGFYGEGPKRKAYEMIEKGWVEFLGTDMHNTLYAQALIDASHDRKIIKLMEKQEFQNRHILEPSSKSKNI